MLSVTERARRIGTFRYIEVRLMEITAAWTPTTPEMEVKVMFGRHIWNFARHADALGKRTFELRQPEHYTLAPDDAYLQMLTNTANVRATTARLENLYDTLLPSLTDEYHRYLAETDRLLDAPSVVIIEQIIRDLAEMRDDSVDLRRRVTFDGAPVLAAR